MRSSSTARGPRSATSSARPATAGGSRRRRWRSSAGRTEAGTDPQLRDRLARAWIGLEVIRAYALDTLAEPPVTGAEASVLKVLWSRWHQALGELAMDVRGAGSMIGSDAGELDTWQRLFLFGRAETIYGGSDEIQRNIIAARALGLPRPVRGGSRCSRCSRQRRTGCST